jgi:hypothetical protein
MPAKTATTARTLCGLIQSKGGRLDFSVTSYGKLGTLTYFHRKTWYATLMAKINECPQFPSVSEPISRSY